MGQILLPKRLSPGWARPRVKPNGPLEIDWSNPLSRGLHRCVVASNGGAVELARGVEVVKGSGPKISGTIEGQSPFFDSTDPSILTVDTDDLDESTVYFRFNGNVPNGSAATSGTWPTGWILGPDDGDRLIYFYNGNTANKAEITGQSLNDGKFHGVAGVYSETDGGLLYLDGVQRASDTPIGTQTFGTSVQIGSRGDSIGNFKGDIPLFLIWSRAMSPGELRALELDPYQILKPAVQQSYFFPSGGGGITGTGTPQAATATASGAGVVSIAGTGTPQAATATASGEGTVSGTIEGTGTPQAATATAAGAGVVSIAGTGTPQAETATAAGAGVVSIAGTGTPQAATATASGAGVVSIAGTGSPQAVTATASGAGTASIVGTGNPQATTATASGTGTVTNLGGDDGTRRQRSIAAIIRSRRRRAA